MKKKLIIFDLDGTIIDTIADLNAAVNYAVSRFDYPSRTMEQTKNDIGNGVAKLIARSIPDGEYNPNYAKCLKIFREYYVEHYFDKSKPYPDVYPLLKELKDRGYRLAVVSNKFDEGAKSLVTYFYPNTFDIIQGTGENFSRKPDPQMINFVLKSLAINKKDTLFVGDTNVDYESARNADIDIVLVSYGYRSREFLSQFKNVPIIDTPLELLTLDYFK